MSNPNAETESKQQAPLAPSLVTTQTPLQQQEWDEENQRQFARWQLLQLDEAKILACCVSHQAYFLLNFLTFYADLLDTNEKVTNDTIVSLAIDFLDFDLSDLSCDFEGTTFEACADLLGDGITDTVEKMRTLAPATAPVLQSMELAPDEKARLCDDIAWACRQEFGNAVAQIATHHTNARRGRDALELLSESNPGATSRQFSVDALASVSELLDLPLLLGSWVAEPLGTEASNQVVTETMEEVAATCRLADEGHTGVARAMKAVQANVEVIYESFAQHLVGRLIESGIAPNIDWKDLAEQYLTETAQAFRALANDETGLRRELADLPLSDEVHALVP